MVGLKMKKLSNGKNHFLRSISLFFGVMLLSTAASAQTATTLVFDDILSFQHRTNFIEIVGIQEFDIDPIDPFEPLPTRLVEQTETQFDASGEAGIPLSIVTLGLFDSTSEHHQECVDLLTKAMDSNALSFTIEVILRDDENDFSSRDQIRSCGLQAGFRKGGPRGPKGPVGPGPFPVPVDPGFE